MMPATSKNVKKVINDLQSRTGITQEELAALLGVSTSGLKKNFMSGPSHRPMSASTWQLLLLFAGKHPQYELKDRMPIAKRK